MQHGTQDAHLKRDHGPRSRWLGLAIFAGLGVTIGACKQTPANAPTQASPSSAAKKSVQGESCLKSDDCAGNLGCVERTCQPRAPKAPPGEAAEAADKPTLQPRTAQPETAPPVPASPGVVEFAYTPPAVDKCAKIQGNGDAGSEVRCPGLGGFALHIYIGDHGTHLDVEKGGRVIVHGPQFNWGHVSPKVAEWRHRSVAGETVVHGLIFRMYYEGDDDPEKKSSKLFAVRLTGKPCIVGSTTDNKKARSLADDDAAICRPELSGRQ